MENRVTQKNVTVSGRTYQINKIDARAACWLFAFMGSRADASSILSALGKCSRTEFDEVQAMVLKNVFFMDTDSGNTFPLAIFGPNGSWADHFLETNSEALFRLTSESIIFNLSPFLVVSESNSQPSM